MFNSYSDDGNNDDRDVGYGGGDGRIDGDDDCGGADECERR